MPDSKEPRPLDASLAQMVEELKAVRGEIEQMRQWATNVLTILQVIKAQTEPKGVVDDLDELLKEVGSDG